MSEEDHVSLGDPDDSAGTAVVPANRNGSTPPGSRISVPPVLARYVPKDRTKRGRPKKEAPPKERSHKRQNRNNKNGRLVHVFVVLLVLLGPVALARSFGTSSRITSTHSELKADFYEVDRRINQNGILTSFPLGDAKAKALRLANECFTFENLRQDSQLKQLQAAGVPPEYCSWNGKGTSQVLSAVTVDAPYWVKRETAHVIVQVKLYRRLGYFHLYVPFTKDKESAKFAGTPSLFGVGTGATEVAQACKGIGGSPEEEKSLTQTASDFLKGLAGELEIDIRRVTGGTNFGDFSGAIHAPRIEEIMICQKQGEEVVFTAMVRSKGPGKGSQFSFPYSFLAVSKSGLYQIKKFGPAPLSKEE